MRIALLVLLLLLIALSASTTRAEETYAVTGVPSDDVLNIRSAPSAASGLSAIWPARKRNPVAFFAVREAGRLSAAARPRRMAGWNARYLAPVRAAAGLRLPLSCIGTEPFWSLALRSTAAATFFQPGTAAVIASPSPASSGRAGARASVSASPARASSARKAAVTACPDDSFPYAITFSLTDGRRFSGCCR